MLHGDLVIVRPVMDDDVDTLWRHHADLADRGPFFPLGVMSLPRFRRQFEESGFLGEDDGMLVVTDPSGVVVGHVEFFRTVKYLDEIEISYQIYGLENRGKGIATEALRLLTRYLFERRNINRIRLIIHHENAASKRVAEKAGYASEGISRGAWYNRGKHHDVAVYAALKDEFLGAECERRSGDDVS